MKRAHDPDGLIGPRNRPFPPDFHYVCAGGPAASGSPSDRARQCPFQRRRYQSRERRRLGREIYASRAGAGSLGRTAGPELVATWVCVGREGKVRLGAWKRSRGCGVGRKLRLYLSPEVDSTRRQTPSYSGLAINHSNAITVSSDVPRLATNHSQRAVKWRRRSTLLHSASPS